MATIAKNNLMAANLHLAKEWHPTKNENLTPKDITTGSHKKVWWQCSKGHEWQAVVSNRSRGSGCPFCVGKAVCDENCLHTINSELAKEWHPTKNGSLTPRDVTAYSGKKVWWQCGKGHEWQAALNNRSNGRGCPYCLKRGVNEKNCLQKANPYLAKEWHPTKNGELTPRDVTAYSGKKVWWQCGKGHEWQATLYNRSNERECPYCSHLLASKEYCLQTVNPDLAKEWHPTKNLSLTPKDILPSIAKKVWWLCSRGHEWQVSVNSRSSRKTGCPYCHSQTSQLELRVFCEMKYIFTEIEHRKRIEGKECDIYIPLLKLGIEIDGFYWHKSKSEKEKEKEIFFKNRGVSLIRIREKGLERLSDTDIFYSSTEKYFNIIQKLAKEVAKQSELNESSRIAIELYLQREKFANDKEYKQLWAMLPSPISGNSLFDANQTLAKEWHPAKNGYLTPKDVYPYSNLKVWWQCSKEHEWQAKISDRNNRGCPYCSGRRASVENCLQKANPDLAKEWHPTKNGNLTPRDVTAGSHKKVWWQCSKEHEWQAEVGNRSNGNGCPYCSGRRASVENCLQKANPDLAKEWHPTKNGNLTLRGVTAGSHKKVWWQCSKGHEWQSVVAYRSKGSGCPYCLKRGVNEKNCLHKINPDLSKEWHPTKNGELTPMDVTAYSWKKVWWQCGKGHEWQAALYNRSNGRGCPTCARRHRKTKI